MSNDTVQQISKIGREKQMKLFKRLMAVMFALTLTLGVGTRVYAEDETTTHTITNGSTTHSYEIYQIFTGKYDSATGQLQGLKYGENAVGTTGSAVSAADLKKLSEYNDAGDTQALDQKDIAFISQFVNLNSNPHKTIAKGANVSVEEGYYLIKDVDGSLANTNEQYTLYLISVLNEDITILLKQEQHLLKRKLMISMIRLVPLKTCRILPTTILVILCLSI